MAARRTLRVPVVLRARGLSSVSSRGRCAADPAKMPGCALGPGAVWAEGAHSRARGRAEGA